MSRSAACLSSPVAGVVVQTRPSRRVPVSNDAATVTSNSQRNSDRRRAVARQMCRAATDFPAKVGGWADVTEEGDAKQQGTAVADDKAAPVDPTTMFPYKHFPRITLALALYFPIGCILAVFRMLLWVALLAVDLPFLSNNNFMIRVLHFILGVNVKWRNKQLLPDGRYVMVSNHQTTGDLMCLYRLPHHIVHLISSAVPKAATKVRNHRLRLWHASPEVYNELSDPKQTEPVHLFPEGGMTNGKGMMQFSRGFMRFAKKLPIVPVALRISQPFDISTHTLTSPFLVNMFFTCFLPWVSLEATVLPPMKKDSQELNVAFVERVQQKIADELKVPIAELTIKQKRAMIAAAKSASA
ncbi:hypothetical protein BSKO_01535 [Bryopsis sp. KO-2023]|nr:hypothetical protein BSKO_01535 [Bryopsis sp. KO-2023]